MIFFLNNTQLEDKDEAIEAYYQQYLVKLVAEAPSGLRHFLTHYTFHDVEFLEFAYHHETQLLSVEAFLLDNQSEYHRVTLHFTGFLDAMSIYPSFDHRYVFRIGGGYRHSGEFHYNHTLDKYEFYFENDRDSLPNRAVAQGIYHQEYKLLFDDLLVLSSRMPTPEDMQAWRKRKEKH